MTYTYLSIRRELWESENKNPITKFRTIKELWELSTKFARIVLICYMVFFIVFVVNFFFFTSDWLYWISIIGIVIPVSIYSLCKERIRYVHQKRTEELQNLQLMYDAYVNETTQILLKYKVDSDSKRKLLKNESENILSKYRQKHEGLISRLVSGITIPFVSYLLIEVNSVSSVINITSALSFVIIIFMIYQLSKLSKFVSYYVNGYNKDEYLLSTLNELDYQ